MKITVTQEHIDRGIGCDVQGCALALAIGEACPVYDVKVGLLVGLFPLIEGPIIYATLPKEAAKFKDAFDMHKKAGYKAPKPMSFELDIETGGTPPRVRTSVYDGLENANASY